MSYPALEFICQILHINKCCNSSIFTILPSFSSTALLPCLKAPPLPQAHTLLQPALLLTSNLPTPSFSPLKMLFQYDQVANNAIVSPSSSHTIQSTALLQLQFQLTAEVEVVVVVVVVVVIQPAREARRLAQRAEWPRRGLSACFGAGCYIEMATSCH